MLDGQVVNKLLLKPIVMNCTKTFEILEEERWGRLTDDEITHECLTLNSSLDLALFFLVFLQSSVFRPNKKNTPSHPYYLSLSPSLSLKIKPVFWLLVTHHVLQLHNCPKNLECELSFSTGTFFNNYDVTDRKLKPLCTYSTVGKQKNKRKIL